MHNVRTDGALFVFQQILKKWTVKQSPYSPIRHYLGKMMMHVHKIVGILSVIEHAMEQNDYPYPHDKEAMEKWAQNQLSKKVSHFREIHVKNVNIVFASIEIVSMCITDFINIYNGIVTNANSKTNAAYANVDCAKATKMTGPLTMVPIKHADVGLKYVHGKMKHNLNKSTSSSKLNSRASSLDIPSSNNQRNKPKSLRNDKHEMEHIDEDQEETYSLTDDEKEPAIELSQEIRSLIDFVIACPGRYISISHLKNKGLSAATFQNYLQNAGLHPNAVMHNFHGRVLKPMRSAKHKTEAFGITFQLMQHVYGLGSIVKNLKLKKEDGDTESLSTSTELPQGISTMFIYDLPSEEEWKQYENELQNQSPNSNELQEPNNICHNIMAFCIEMGIKPQEYFEMRRLDGFKEFWISTSNKRSWCSTLTPDVRNHRLQNMMDAMSHNLQERIDAGLFGRKDASSLAVSPQYRYLLPYVCHRYCASSNNGMRSGTFSGYAKRLLDHEECSFLSLALHGAPKSQSKVSCQINEKSLTQLTDLASFVEGIYNHDSIQKLIEEQEERRQNTRSGGENLLQEVHARGLSKGLNFAPVMEKMLKKMLSTNSTASQNAEAHIARQSQRFMTIAERNHELAMAALRRKAAR